MHLRGQNNEMMIDLGINAFNEREFGKSYQLFQKALKGMVKLMNLISIKLLN